MKSPARKLPPLLKQFVNLWTLQQQPTADREWSLEEKFRQVKKAGFDGIGFFGADSRIAPLCQSYGFDLVCYFDANAKTYRERLEAAREMKPVRINVQMCDHDTPPKEATRVWVKLAAFADKLGLQADLEVHRDTCTETPEKVYEIAALYQKATGEKIRFSWDFSHIAAVKHIYPPYSKRLLVRPDLIQLSRQMHFRPFNGHHAQIPATDGKGKETPEIKPYLEFVQELLACWLKAAKGGEALYVCPEFGPVMSGYGLSSFPDVWKDAIFMRERTEEIWKANLRKSIFA
jgi:hypothetical protein